MVSSKPKKTRAQVMAEKTRKEKKRATNLERQRAFLVNNVEAVTHNIDHLTNRMHKS
jgi:hypothetical protein